MCAFLILALCGWLFERAEPERSVAEPSVARDLRPPPPGEETRIVAPSAPADVASAPAAAVERVEPIPAAAVPKVSVVRNPVAPSTGLRLMVRGARAGDAPTVVEVTYAPEGGGCEVTEHVLGARAEARLALGAGRVRVVARRGEAVSAIATADLAEGAWTPLVVELEDARQVEGRVVSAHDGEPVADARVAFWTFAETDVVRTDGEGYFSHPRFPRGTKMHQVRVTAPGHGPATAYLRIEEDGRWTSPSARAEGLSGSGAGVPFLEVALPPELVVTGRVVDSAGAPVPGARVSLEGFVRVLPRVASRDATETVAAADGSFALGGLRDDVSHGLRVEAPGYAQLELELPSHGGPRRLDELRLESEHLVAGVVLEAHGHPVEDLVVLLEPNVPAHGAGAITAEARASSAAELDVPVRIDGALFETRTSAAGTFLFEGLVAGPRRLTVLRDGEVLLERDLEVIAGEELVLWLGDRTPVLEGQVFEGADVVHGARVRIEAKERVAEVSTDDQGRFRVPGLKPGRVYRVTATWSVGGSTREARAEARAGDRLRLVRR